MEKPKCKINCLLVHENVLLVVVICQYYKIDLFSINT